MFPIGIFWGFLSCLSWGWSDFLASLYSKQQGSFQTAFYVQVIGLFPLLLVAAVPGSSKIPLGDIDWSILSSLGSIIGFLMVLMYLAYYQGLAKGMVSVVTAVASAWLPVSVILGTVFLGEMFQAYQGVLIAFISLGIILLSINLTSSGDHLSGFPYGLAAMLLLGIAAALFKPLVLATGPIPATVFAKIVTIGGFMLLIAILRVSIQLPALRNLPTLTTAAIFDSGGYIFYSFGLWSAPIYIVAPIAAAHPLATMSLAWKFTHERPSKIQTTGIFITISGVLALSSF